MSRYELMMIDQFHACPVALDEEAFTRFFVNAVQWLTGEFPVASIRHRSWPRSRGHCRATEGCTRDNRKSGSDRHRRCRQSSCTAPATAAQSTETPPSGYDGNGCHICQLIVEVLMPPILKSLQALFDSEPCNCDQRPCVCLVCGNCRRRIGRWKSICKCGWEAPSLRQHRQGFNNGSSSEAAGVPGIPGISSGNGSGGGGPAGP
jgi:hypothetical protein